MLATLAACTEGSIGMHFIALVLSEAKVTSGKVDVATCEAKAARYPTARESNIAISLGERKSKKGEKRAQCTVG